MKALHAAAIAGFSLMTGLVVQAQTNATYTNFIRQTQFESGANPIIGYLNGIAPIDEDNSPLAINPGGATFQLWTVREINGQLTSFLLAQTYVSAYMPTVENLSILTEDQTWPTPRTRADRAFQVVVNMDGLLLGETVPEAARRVNLFHHVQPTTDATETQSINWTQASQVSVGSITGNDINIFPFAVHSIPAVSLHKGRGQERFLIESLPDAASDAPATELASKTIQIWPCADGSIAGITNGQRIRFRLPQLTLTLNDLYPNSTTYLKAYRGPLSAVPNSPGRVILESQVPLNQELPKSEIRVVQGYDAVVDTDGEWTFELVTDTPFGRGEYLDHVTFTIDRSLDFKGGIHTIE